MANELPATAWTRALGELPLFTGVSKRDLRAIARLGEMRRYRPGQTIVLTGRPGDAFFVILEGYVEVKRQGRRTVRLDPGGFFGELALFDDAPRAATVEAAENDEVLTMRLGRAGFLRMIEREPRIARRLLQTLARRLRETEMQSY